MANILPVYRWGRPVLLVLDLVVVRGQESGSGCQCFLGCQVPWVALTFQFLCCKCWADILLFSLQLSLKTVTWCGSRACGRQPSPATWPPSTSRKEASWPWPVPRLPSMGLLVRLHFPICEMGMLILAHWGSWVLPYNEEYWSPLPSEVLYVGVFCFL